LKKVIKNLKDGFANVLKGLGTSKDPRMNDIYLPGQPITQQMANDLYTYNWIAAKGIDIPVEDALKKWREFNVEDSEKKDKIEKIYEKFQIKKKVETNFKWSRLFGGSVIVIIIDGEDPEEPLDIDSIKPESLRNFVVLDRYNIFPETINLNILSENYGEPEYYSVVRDNGSRIHHSRVIKTNGSNPTIFELEKNYYWGNSIFDQKWEPVKDCQLVSNSISTLLYEACIDVYKIEGLYEMIAEGEDDLVLKRLKILNEMKSLVNGIVLDTKDSYEKKSTSFTNLADIYNAFKQNVAGSFNIPVTRFWGTSPGGLNATGESDMLNYFDYLLALQTNNIKPVLDRIDAIIFKSELNEKPLPYKFLPLKQLSEEEQANVEAQIKERDLGYFNAGLIEKTDVLSSLAQTGTYSTIDTSRIEEEKEALELEFEEYEEEENENNNTTNKNN